MRTLIRNGLLIDPANKVNSRLNLLIEGGKVVAVTEGIPESDAVIDAEGKVVCPGFIDIHMHEDPVNEDGKIESEEEDSIFSCMLRQGVTTAIGGNCGISLYHPADYLDIADRDGVPVNVGMLAGHEFFRRMSGCEDRYAKAGREQKDFMASELEKALDRGCFGISYGIRYSPGIDEDELMTTAKACLKEKKLLAAHIRSDAEEVFASLKELLDLGKNLKLPVEVSHIGSMAGFGQMEAFMRIVDEYVMNGLDAACDCYPYYAFSTTIGSTTYDEGWLSRYNCDYGVIEICSGKYKGRRCSEEIFREVRREDPECLTLCYVMKREDVDFALKHPNVMLASDGILDRGQGHPRAAGAFPRLIDKFVKIGKISLYDGISMMTSMPAGRLGLADRGRLNAGARADVVVFDPALICDEATFGEPTLAPKGIDLVLIGGETAAKDGVIVSKYLGRAVRK